LNFWDKASLFSLWEVVGFAGTNLTIFGSVFYTLTDQFRYTDAETLLGFGVFLIWIKSVTFFKGIHPYDLMVKTVSIAAPTFLRVIAGVVPYIVGAGFLTITLFWKSHDYFKNYGKAQWYVFATQTGDGIFAMFTEMIQASYFFGFMFGFMYDFLIISCV